MKNFQKRIYAVMTLILCVELVVSQDNASEPSCEPTFFNTNVTLVGAKDISTVSGCFEYSEAFRKVTLIQIIKENVPVLKKNAISGLVKLVDIILDSDGITDLKPGCFSNLPNLYLIKMRHNNFSTIREGVFNNLTVSELCLTDNKIESIHPKAFNDLPNLKILFLDQNRIAYWSNRWFFNSPSITELNFKENLITTVPYRAFDNVKGVHNSTLTNIYLNENKIRYISDEAFEGIDRLGWLMLQKNEIEEISEQSLGTTLKSIDWIRLEHNQLKCIPEKLVNISQNVIYYLSHNPLTPECKEKFDIIKNSRNHEE